MITHPTEGLLTHILPTATKSRRDIRVSDNSSSRTHKGFDYINVYRSPVMPKLSEEEAMERECLSFMRKHLFVKRKQMDMTGIAEAREKALPISGAVISKKQAAYS